MNYYICFTPYHLILTGALQIGYNNAEAVLIFGDEAGVESVLPSYLSALDLSAVRRLEIFGQRRSWQVAPLSRINRHRTLQTVRSAKPGDVVHVFVGIRPEAQALRHRLPRGVSLHYVEDGMDAYLKATKPKSGLYERALYRFMFGPTDPTWDLTTSLPFDRYHVLIPELARATQRGFRVEPIRPDWFRASVQRFGATVATRVGVADISHLYLLRHSESVPNTSAYLGQVATWLEAVRHTDPSARPAVKAHPREASPAFQAAMARLQAPLLPASIPAELLAPCLRPSCTLVSALSTFVLTSKVLLPDRVIQLEAGTDVRLQAFLTAWDPDIQGATTGSAA